MACLPSQQTCYCGAVSKIKPLVYCGYSFVHIICCLFCSFIFCLLVLCYIAHHWIFLRHTVNKSHLSFTSTGQAIILFCFPEPKTSRSRSASVYCITPSMTFLFRNRSKIRPHLLPLKVRHRNIEL